jgi:hypothetical protein
MNSLRSTLALIGLRVHLSLMDLQACRTVSLILLFNAIGLPASVLAEDRAHVESISQKDMAEQIRKAREADRRREARREERARESEAAKTVRALAPPKESREEQRAREARDAEARREVRAADRLRDSNRAAARRARAGRSDR